ncbi:hypothetical protein J1605_014663 [Eschrichtius robustus]|uniref:40S ribosomal protein S19 n=1 Tax=Eschrichtius robustus TaxID=9764 RepID=A0AB34GEQ4_ESCRO|nr:hypothetical protein J1605_014663 [Eschrichtius robustus]
MPGVTVKDVNQQEFVRALAALLKKSGKLKVPEWVDTVKLAKHKDLAPYDASCFHSTAPVPPGRRWALEGLKMVEKDQDGGHKLTPQGQRDLDRIAGQVAAANKKH